MTTFRIARGDEVAGAADLAVALAQLDAAEVVGPEAAEHRAFVIDFVRRHHDAALRANQRGHLTGSALVIDPERGRTLLMLHRKLGRWFQPGGHADGDADLAAVALREAAEETGIGDLAVVVPAIDVDVHRVAPPGEPAHLHLDVRYLVLAPGGAEESGNRESLALAWVDEEAIADLVPAVDASTRRLVRRGFEVLRQL